MGNHDSYSDSPSWRIAVPFGLVLKKAAGALTSGPEIL